MALGGYPLRHIQTDDRRVNTGLSVTAPGDLPAWAVSVRKLSFWPAQELKSTSKQGNARS